MSDTEAAPKTKTKSKRSSGVKVKPKVDKYNGFKVPTKGRASVRWVIYIYDMIREAKPELLQREDIKNAYNALIECLLTYEGDLISWIPPKYHRYKEGIKQYKSSYSYFEGLPLRFSREYEAYNNADIKKQYQESSSKILHTYYQLYELIKRDVVPFMETKYHEHNSRKQLDYYHKLIEKTEKDIKQYEAAIEGYRKALCEYAKKALELTQPPVLTKFD